MSITRSGGRTARMGGRVPARRLDRGLILGLGLLGLGVGMIDLGIVHGLAHGSCSSTGYSRDYGPVPTCGRGTGWWMLMLMAGLLTAGGGAVLARAIGPLLVPLVFATIGAPFIALALGSHGQLLMNTSSSTGKIFAGAFGGLFLAVGLLWGVAVARYLSGVSGASVRAGLLAALAGLAGAFAMASGVSGAIGKTSAVSSSQVVYGSAPGTTVTVRSAAAERLRQIALCRDLVTANRLLLARDRTALMAECGAHWVAAERQLPAAAHRWSLVHAAAQCRRGLSTAELATAVGSAAASTLAAACGTPSASQGAGLQRLQATLCRQIVKAQVPEAEQSRALASCPKT